MSVGRDYSFGYYDNNTGQVIDLGDVQSVKIMAQKHDISNRPYNKPATFGYIPDGFKITFTFTRTGKELEDFALDQAAFFNAGNIVKSGFLNETITNADGSVSRYQYTKFVFFMTDVGDVSREKVVNQTAEGMASEKVRIA